MGSLLWLGLNFRRVSAEYFIGFRRVPGQFLSPPFFSTPALLGLERLVFWKCPYRFLHFCSHQLAANDGLKGYCDFPENAYRLDDKQKNNKNVQKVYIKQPFDYSVCFFPQSFRVDDIEKNNSISQLSSRDNKQKAFKQR